MLNSDIYLPKAMPSPEDFNLYKAQVSRVLYCMVGVPVYNGCSDRKRNPFDFRILIQFVHVLTGFECVIGTR